MKGLSALAKFLGVYEDWKRLIKDYGLKWMGKSSDEIVIDRLTKITNVDEVFEWIKDVKVARPKLACFMDFMAITGLRLVEAVESCNLIIKLAKEGRLSEYYSVERGTLEHYKFKALFIRRTKKVFISFVPEDIVQKICADKPLPTAGAIPKLVKRRGLKLRFGDIREAHATYTTKYLRDMEIDFLHGRVTANVFMRNYFNPALINDLKQRAFKAVQDILTKIS